MSRDRKITVTDVSRGMNLVMEKEVAWAVGAAVRDLYELKYGALPEKELRTKTSGGGTHCFAVYPERMRPEIARIIRRHKTESDRQGRLF